MEQEKKHDIVQDQYDVLISYFSRRDWSELL